MGRLEPPDGSLGDPNGQPIGSLDGHANGFANGSAEWTSEWTSQWTRGWSQIDRSIHPRMGSWLDPKSLFRKRPPVAALDGHPEEGLKEGLPNKNTLYPGSALGIHRSFFLPSSRSSFLWLSIREFLEGPFRGRGSSGNQNGYPLSIRRSTGVYPGSIQVSLRSFLLALLLPSPGTRSISGSYPKIRSGARVLLLI